MSLPFKAVISDMDGTLLNGDHVLGDYTIDVLKKLSQLGVDIILATGRGYVDMAAILAKITVKSANLVTSNGAQAHNLAGERLYHNFIPEQMAFDIMQTPFDDKKVCLNTYQNNDWFISKDIPQMKKYHQDSGFDYQVVDFAKHHGRDTEKVFFIAREPQDLEPIEQYLTAKFGDKISMAYSTPQCFEVMNKNVSKASALEFLMSQRDYDLKDCIAFGDGMNDVEMLAAVGKGCIMQDADPRLKLALPQLEQIGSNKQESVAHYLAKIFQL